MQNVVQTVQLWVWGLRLPGHAPLGHDLLLVAESAGQLVAKVVVGWRVFALCVRGVRAAPTKLGLAAFGRNLVWRLLTLLRPVFRHGGTAPLPDCAELALQFQKPTLGLVSCLYAR